jgi:hypothetical protein
VHLGTRSSPDGIGVNISTVFLSSARAWAAELGVADRVSFVHGDASGYVASLPVGIASCIGATGSAGASRAQSACSDAASPLTA